MKPYIFGVRNKIHIIDLRQTEELVKPALSYVKSVAQKNNKILFVGTKHTATKIIKSEAERCNMPYVNERWLGGMLTNYKTIRSSIRRLEDLLRQKEDGTFDKLTKKEGLKLQREIDRLPKDQKFFFCSDNSDVYKYFAEKYPDRIILYDRKIFNDPKLAESGHHDDIQITTDAFIELLILSKCDKIIGTYASSFDEVAWWFGSCQAEVIIPEPKNFDEEFNDLIYVKK